jgi:fructose-specific component phosphotransferase system IIB-like protein
MGMNAAAESGAVAGAGLGGASRPLGYSTWTGSVLGGTVTATPSEVSASGKAQWTVTLQRPNGSSATTQVWLSKQFSAAQLTPGSATKTQLEAALAAQSRPLASGALSAPRPDTEVDHRVQAIRSEARGRRNDARYELNATLSRWTATQRTNIEQLPHDIGRLRDPRLGSVLNTVASKFGYHHWMELLGKPGLELAQQRITSGLVQAVTGSTPAQIQQRSVTALNNGSKRLTGQSLLTTGKPEASAAQVKREVDRALVSLINKNQRFAKFKGSVETIEQLAYYRDAAPLWTALGRVAQDASSGRFSSAQELLSESGRQQSRTAPQPAKASAPPQVSKPNTTNAAPSALSWIGDEPASAMSPASVADLRTLLQSKAIGDVVQTARDAGLYRQPIPNRQDAQCNAQADAGGKYLDAMPPYVFSPRRQTDQMVRQAYELLPPALKRDVAFVHAQRVAQDPQGAARQMFGKKEVVIVGSFKGVNKATSENDAEARQASKVHPHELKALEISLRLAKAMNVKVRDVQYGMGDSSPKQDGNRFVPNRFAVAKKGELESRMRTVLRDNGYQREERLSWGADELMMTAFAAQLPERSLSVNVQNPGSRFFFDGGATADQLIKAAAEKAGLTIVGRGAPASIHLHAFTLLPGANTSGDQTYPDRKEFAVQHRSDQTFARAIAQLDKATLSRSVIIDARLNNGAMDGASLPPTTNVLGYSAWGTGGNNFGQGLAMAKIVADAQDRAGRSGNTQQVQYVNAARRQFVVEAIAHDAFFIGDANRASAVTPVTAAATPSPGRGECERPASAGESLTPSQLKDFYAEASRNATQQMRSKYGGFGGRIQFVPQPFNRLFEASTLFSNGVVPQAGSISSELVKDNPAFDPSGVYRGYAPDPLTGDQAVGSNGRFFETRPPWWQRLFAPFWR